jgi:hypothetical protein
VRENSAINVPEVFQEGEMNLITVISAYYPEKGAKERMTAPGRMVYRKETKFKIVWK